MDTLVTVTTTDTFRLIILTNFTITNFLPTLVSMNTANRGIGRIEPLKDN